MKRYDEWGRIKHNITHLETIITPAKFTADELKAFVNGNTYTVTVHCRSCGNLHYINSACEVCGLPSKVAYKGFD